MFNLDKAITNWRQQMAAGGIRTPKVLDELESHLRVDVEQQMQSGLNAQQAFEIVVLRIGQAGALKAEFKKLDGIRELRLGKLLGVACCAIACLFSLLILQVLITAPEPILAERLLGLTAIASIIFGWKYGHRFLPVIRNKHIRTLAELVCCLAGFVGMALFIKFILPRFIERPLGSEIPVGRALVSFLWAWAMIATLGGVAYGLEKTARRQNETAAE